MNDGDYPRQTAPRDFDLMAQSWRAGDRSRREDDRYLFLEALLSARERLYLSWQGHRATDNTAQAPSVLVAQLLDYLNAGWTPARVAVAQPLQPYSEAYFRKDSPFQTYDNEWAPLHGADAENPSAATRQPTPTPAPTPTRAPAPQTAALPLALTLDDLRQLLRQPVEVFFKARLRVRFEAMQETVQELEPFALNGLEKYQAGQTLLQAQDPQQALAELRLSGTLPLAAFGERMAATMGRELDVVLQRRDLWRAQYPADAPAVSIALQVDGLAIGGTLNGLWCTPDGSAYLQIGQRLGAVLEGTGEDACARGHIVTGLWVNHLLACASGLTLVSVQLGLDGLVQFAPLTQGLALGILQGLVGAYRAAWQRPLPVACKTAWAYCQAETKNQRLALSQPDKADKQKDPHEAAQAVFEGGFLGDGECAESPYLARAFASYHEIEAELPHWAQALYGALAQHATLPGAAQATE
jgi:exodeoxyribonuclease V gamma subunit